MLNCSIHISSIVDVDNKPTTRWKKFYVQIYGQLTGTAVYTGALILVLKHRRQTLGHQMNTVAVNAYADHLIPNTLCMYRVYLK